MGRIELGNIPKQITVEDAYDPELVGFPLNLLYTALVPGRCVRVALYEPDPVTFVEDADIKQMMYYPAQPSRYSVRVIYKKKQGCWQTFKYREDKLIRCAFGPTFQNAMLHTTFGGPEPDERTLN